MIGKRRQAREEALQVLYAFEMNRNMIEDVLNDVSIIRPGGNSFDPFTHELVTKAVEREQECSALIEKHARNWELNRIALIDKLILRLAITEFLCFSDISPKVTINEALEIAKKFSTVQSVRFVNGILDAVLTRLSAEHHIVKEGRGLETGPAKTQKLKGNDI